MTTIAFDHQIFTNQRVGGISRLFCRLIEEANRFPDFRIISPFLFTNNMYLRHSPAFARHRWLERMGVRLTEKAIKRFNRRYERSICRLARFDVFHPTYYRDYFLDELDGRPFVLSVVDMIPELFPGLYPSTPHEDKQGLIPKASAIIAISETTKRDLLKFHPIPAERVHVAPLGAPHEFSFAGVAPSLPDDYVLFVGDRARYKNFDRFAGALSGIMMRRPCLHLVCAGGGPLRPEELHPFVAAGCPDRVVHCTPDEDTLPWIYRKARVFAFPSWYEGFGLPVLEAFTYGCPAALSTADSFREVADDAALYFDPFDPAAIADGIERLLDDPDLRAELVRRGAVRVRDFSWRQMADQTFEVYRSVAAERRGAR